MKDKIFQFINKIKGQLIELFQKVFIVKLKPQIILSFRFLLDFWKHNPAYLICTVCYFFICNAFINHSFLLLINDKIKVTKKGKIKITKNGCFF